MATSVFEMAAGATIGLTVCPRASLVARPRPAAHQCSMKNLKSTSLCGASFSMRSTSTAGAAAVSVGKRVCVVAATGFGKPGGGKGKGDTKDAEKSLKSTMELDKFIDQLRSAGDNELPLLVAENVLAFDQKFWLRLVTRAESSSSVDDRRDFEELAQNVMEIVEKVVKKTHENMDSTSDALASMLRQLGDDNEEISWPPSGEVLAKLRQEVEQWDEDGRIDEKFLASVSAQLRQATEATDKPGLVAMLQKVLQLYASARLGRRSYATRRDGTIDEAEEFLETLIQAPEETWDSLLQTRLTCGGGSLPEADLYTALEKRAERIFMRTESGSYEQRILGEYLKELEARARAVAAAYSTPPQLPS
ncbi:unnamed protein product [Closterium sp. Yama58-4]|nr:unnamed protein product [Closterium sp. Yama58-4]